MKKYIIILYALISVSSVFGQKTEYKKFYLSAGYGRDFPMKSSDENIGAEREFLIPYSEGFQLKFDGAWFLTPNYGVGLKYRYHKSGEEVGDYSILDGVLYDNKYLISKSMTADFDEITHFIGPAAFGRWKIGKSKWEVYSSLGVGLVSDKLYNLINIQSYGIIDYTGIIDGNKMPEGYKTSYSDIYVYSFGTSFSAGIRYQLMPWLGLGIYADGLFAAPSKIKFENGDLVPSGASRNLNRIGISAGLDFSF
jgi:hypothetical protein